MNVSEISVEASSGGTSSKVAISAASAQGPVVSRPTNHPKGAPVKCAFTPDTNCFFRKGTNPTALADGTDFLLLANNTYRTELMEDERLAFITSGGSGFVYFTPAA